MNDLPLKKNRNNLQTIQMKFIIPKVDHVDDEVASLIGSICGCRLASDTFNCMPDTMLPSICEKHKFQRIICNKI